MRNASLREERVVFLKEQLAATEEQVQRKKTSSVSCSAEKQVAETGEPVRKKKKQTPSVSSSNPSLLSQEQESSSSSSITQQQKRKLKVEEGGKEKRIKQEEEDSLAPRTYRWKSGEVELEEEKIPLVKNCPVPKTCKVEVKEESDDVELPSENYKLAMKIIQEGLNHIKRDPTTPSKVISAIKVLEDQANGDRCQEGLNHIKSDPTTPSKVISAIKVLEEQASGHKNAKTDFEDKANGNGGEPIKLEQKESTEEEYFEYF